MHDDDDDDDDLSFISHGHVQYWPLQGGGASIRHYKTHNKRKERDE
jgi:hypothetical protein